MKCDKKCCFDCKTLTLLSAISYPIVKLKLSQWKWNLKIGLAILYPRTKKMLLENALDYRTKRYGNGLMTESFKSFSEFVPRAKNKSHCKNVFPKE